MNHGTDSLEYCRKDWVSEALYSFLLVVLYFIPLTYCIIGQGYRVYGALLSWLATRKI